MLLLFTMCTAESILKISSHNIVILLLESTSSSLSYGKFSQIELLVKTQNQIKLWRWIVMKLHVWSEYKRRFNLIFLPVTEPQQHGAVKGAGVYGTVAGLALDLYSNFSFCRGKIDKDKQITSVSQTVISNQYWVFLCPWWNINKKCPHFSPFREVAYVCVSSVYFHFCLSDKTGIICVCLSVFGAASAIAEMWEWLLSKEWFISSKPDTYLWLWTSGLVHIWTEFILCVVILVCGSDLDYPICEATLRWHSLLLPLFCSCEPRGYWAEAKPLQSKIMCQPAWIIMVSDWWVPLGA